jgi:hypothetical protein
MTISPLRVAQDLWIVDGPTVHWHFPFPTRMTIIRLADHHLLIHSPIDLSAEVRHAVETIGTPRYLVSPNKLHHLFLSQWQETYNDARSFAPPGLEKKRPDLRFNGELGDISDTAWAAQVDQLVFKGSLLLDEVVFFHKPSSTVIFGDLIENLDPGSLSWSNRLIARLGGVLAPHGRPPLDFRLSFLMHRSEARRSLERIFEWQPKRVLMCHGLPVYEDALPFLESAFTWLRGDP